MEPFLHGFTLGLSLIVSFGPQNLFLLRESYTLPRALLLALVCSLCDTLLIALGTITYSSLLSASGISTELASLLAAAMMLWYGAKALRENLQPQVRHKTPNPSQRHAGTCVWGLMVQALGFSLLNPTAITDTLVMVSGSAQQYAPIGRPLFVAGAISMSWLWFFSLTLLAWNLTGRVTPTAARHLGILASVLMLVSGTRMLVSISG